MYLQSWDKTYSAKTYGGESIYDPVVRLSAILSCPCCKQNQPVEAAGYQIRGEVRKLGFEDGHFIIRLAGCIQWGIQDLSKQRPCDHCGVISIMPPADLARLTQLVQEQVTLEWIAQEEVRVVKEQKKVA